MIELHDLSIGYGDRTLLSEVEATIEKGKLTALIGRNGTGKSTLLRAIARKRVALHAAAVIADFKVYIPVHLKPRNSDCVIHSAAVPEAVLYCIFDYRLQNDFRRSARKNLRTDFPFGFKKSRKTLLFDFYIVFRVG